MLRYLNGGESHGKCLLAVLEGVPAGLPLTAEMVNQDLARRQKGYGRGGRMRIEQDRVEFAWDPVTGLVTNTRLAGTGHVLGADGDHVLLLASEAQQGEDLNGDRDRDDL